MKSLQERDTPFHGVQSLFSVLVAIVAVASFSATSTTTTTTTTSVHAFSWPTRSIRRTTTRTSSSRCGNHHRLPAQPLLAQRDSNFPFSTRVALIEKAKQIDANLAQGQRLGSYSSSGWSNRLGTVLTPVALPGVYTADRPFYWNKIDVGCRMTVIQLHDGNLWVHSPVAIDGPLQDALLALTMTTTVGGGGGGDSAQVQYVVSPNYEHVKYAEQWHTTYPKAYMWGCPGLMEKMPHIQWTGEIPRLETTTESSSESSLVLMDGTYSKTLSNCWDFDEIQPLVVDMEVNPFTGQPFFNEVIYYHAPSKTLLTTDLYWNYPTPTGEPNSFLKNEKKEKETDNDTTSTTTTTIVTDWELAPSVDSIPLGSKAWKFGMDNVYLPFYKKLMVKNKSKYQAMVNVILDQWDIETVIPAHGDIIRGKSTIRSILKEHLAL